MTATSTGHNGYLVSKLPNHARDLLLTALQGSQHLSEQDIVVRHSYVNMKAQSLSEDTPAAFGFCPAGTAFTVSCFP